MRELRIRRYNDSDRETVWDLHLLGLAQTGADVGRGPWDDDMRRIEAEYLASGGEFLVGEHDGRIVAMGGFRRLTSLDAELKRMRVHPDFQRRGFGQAILVELEARARAAGIDTLRLDTTIRQLAASELYRKHGYRQIGAETVRGFETLIMAKSLVSDVLDHWQLGHATGIRRPASGVMNLTLLVSTPKGPVVLRGHRRTSIAAVEHELAIIDHAIGHGIPAPAAVPTPSGARVVEHEGRLYSLFEVAPGEEFSRGDLGPDRARAAGQLLAQVQDALADFPMVKIASSAPSETFAAPTTIDTLARIDRLVDHLAQLEQPTPQDRWAAERLRGHAAWLQGHPDYSLPPFPPEALQMTHGDFQLSNIFFDGNRVSALIDWDKAEANFPSFEVVRALHLGLDLRSVLARPFLQGYRSVRDLPEPTLSAAAAYYGFFFTMLDQLWVYETAYLAGDDRTLRYSTPDLYKPFSDLWDATGIT